MNLDLASSIWQYLADSLLVEKVKVVDISSNKLVSVPLEIVHFYKLKTFIASDLGLVCTPDLSSLEFLSTISFKCNSLEVDSLNALPISLQKLDLSVNRFSGFPSAIANLVNLVDLNLSNNKLETTYGLGVLVSMVELVVDDNLIVELSNDLGNLIKLKKLSLKRNHLQKRGTSFEGQSIPASLLKNTSLEILSLDGNPINQVDIMNFEGIAEFMNRRKKGIDKNIQGGALIDFTVFGLN